MLDMKIDLTKANLASLIGQRALSPLDNLFAGQNASDYDEILIRRCQATGKFINFHRDHSLRTIQV
jgi:hypothetical protein